MILKQQSQAPIQNSDEEKFERSENTKSQDRIPKQIQIIEHYVENYMTNYADADQKTIMTNSSNKDMNIKKFLIDTLANFKK